MSTKKYKRFSKFVHLRSSRTKHGKAWAFLQEQEHAFKSGQLGKGRRGVNDNTNQFLVFYSFKCFFFKTNNLVFCWITEFTRNHIIPGISKNKKQLIL